jgi:hypothetical protein
MTNFEKYKDEILEIIEYNTIAVDTKKNKPQSCNEMRCSQCIRYSDDGHCRFLNFFKWLYEEAKESLPALTLKERGFCEIIENGFIARDQNGSLWLFDMMPAKEDDYNITWWNSANGRYKRLDGRAFTFITWESDKAWSIEELLQLEVEG